MSNKEEFGWMLADQVYDINVHGPFSSREDALTDARKYYAGAKLSVTIIVNQITRPLSRNYLPDLDQLLEFMNDQALDEDFCHYDDYIFEVPPDKQEQAAAELEDILLTWANTWIEVADTWTLDEIGGERVTIGEKK